MMAGQIAAPQSSTIQDLKALLSLVKDPKKSLEFLSQLESMVEKLEAAKLDLAETTAALVLREKNLAEALKALEEEKGQCAGRKQHLSTVELDIAQRKAQLEKREERHAGEIEKLEADLKASADSLSERWRAFFEREVYVEQQIVTNVRLTKELEGKLSKLKAAMEV